MKYLKLKSFDDLIRVVLSTQQPVLHHIDIGDRHIYLIPYAIFGNANLVYYVEMETPVKGKYVVYDKFNGSISFSDHVTPDTRLTYLPIVDVEEQNLFSEKIFKKKKKGKKGKNK